MKKAALLAVVVLLAGTFASAQTTGTPVALKAIIPSYIGFTGPNVSTVTFDFTNLGLNVATGLPITKLASALPTWTLMYNLDGTKNVTVCAYASALTGVGSNTIPASSLYGQPVGGSATNPFTGTDCGQANSMLLDTIGSATSNPGKTEGFSGMFLQTPNGTVVHPDTYNGTLNIIAMVQ